MSRPQRIAAPQIAYSLEDAWIAVGLKSEFTLRSAWKNGDIEAHFPSERNPVFLHEDLLDWIKRQPLERAGGAA